MRIAVRPLATANNSFVQLFAKAVEATGNHVFDYEDSLVSMLKYDIAIFHWPNEFLANEGRARTLPRLARLRLARAFGMKLVWVAHNRAVHDRAAALPSMTRAFINSLDGIIYLSSASREIIHESYPVRPHTLECVTVHGLYPPSIPAQAYTPPASDMPVRLASYGQIKPYKNFDLVAALVAGIPDIALHIFGMDSDQTICAKISTFAANNSNITAEFNSEPFLEDQLEERIDASHGVVLPYRDILNSGSALKALSRNRPILVPAIGSLPELAETVGKDWVQLYHGELDRADLAEFAAALRRPRPPQPDLRAYEWSRVSEDLRPFFRDLARLQR
jgi:beta-1,4-mannosyltransferase